MLLQFGCRNLLRIPQRVRGETERTRATHGQVPGSPSATDEFPLCSRPRLHQKGSAVYYDGLARAVSLLHEEKIGARNLGGFAHPAHEQSIAHVLV